MTSKDFKNSLLLEAIKGNLSFHNVEESALDLYKTISKETLNNNKNNFVIEEEIAKLRKHETLCIFQ